MTIQKTNVLVNHPDLGVTISPTMVRNGRISAGAIRLWLLMRSMSTEWKPTIGGYSTLFKRYGVRAGYDTVARWCDQLKRAGYLTITKTKDAGNRWTGWAWATYPIPVEEYIKAQLATYAEDRANAS